MAREIKMTKAENKKLRLFTMHGVRLHEEAGSNQVLGDCPFCDKDQHFYVNRENLLWDCKVCGEAGNSFSFLEKINKRNKENLTERVLRRLGEDRGLPVSALKDWELGYHQGQYTLAVRDSERKVQDLRMYKPGHKVMSTAGAKTGLFGIGGLLKSKDCPVYICEGEWDTMAMTHLLKKAKEKGVAVCSPGAGTFKAEWTEMFRGRKVYVCYDNDQAGYNGQRMVSSRLSGVTSFLRFLHWPQDYNIGYDIRDFYTDFYLKEKKSRKALKRLHGLMKTAPMGLEVEGEEDEDGQIIVGYEAPKIDTSITPEDVHAVYDSKLYMPDHDIIDLCCILMIANYFDTSPLWYFIVAPPSSGKTEVINGFKYFMPPYDNMAMSIGQLTPHSLISGMKSTKDLSLLAKFEGQKKTLFIKDFTPILTKPDNEKADVFSIFRDVHDGSTSKEFGNGVSRHYYDLNFSIGAGVTYQIYDEASVSASLGERFAKIILRSGASLDHQRATVEKAIGNIGKKGLLDMGVAEVVYSGVKNALTWIEANNINSNNLPRVPSWAVRQIGDSAFYTAYMRAGVSRDRFRRDFIKSKPTVERPTRFAMSLAATAIFRAIWYRRMEVNAEDVAYARKVALDTVNQRDEEILRKVYLLNMKGKEPTKRNIQAASSYTPFTVEHVLQDFAMVGVLQTEIVGRKRHYAFTKDFMEILGNAEIYKDPKELNRDVVPKSELEYLEKKPSNRSGSRPRKKLVFRKKKKTT